MKVSIIVAASENGAIGRDNDLIWRFPNDTRFFKDTTLGHHVIMGRKNFESIPHKFRPLPNRVNIIVTRQENYTARECKVVNSIESALDVARKNQESEAFIIGGGEIYKLSMKYTEKIELTKIYKTFEADTFFPKIDRNKWELVKGEFHKKNEVNNFDFSYLTYLKINK